MSFVITISGTSKDCSVTLENQETHTKAEIFALGAILNQYGIISRNGTFFNCVDAYNAVNDVASKIPPGFHGAKLSPFVCRLTNGAFSFRGKDYHTGKFFDGKSAIHGLVYDRLFHIQEQETTSEYAKVTMSLPVDASEEGFPFPYTLEISYKLYLNDALKITTTITNTGDSVMPVSDGWHPYFKLDEKIDNSFLQFRSHQIAIFDEHLLPTGAFEEYADFHSFKPIGNTFLDNSFTLTESEKPALQLKSEVKKLILSVYPDKSYKILQIYTPPTRESIAVENLTSLPDSFNNHIGLLELQPKESKSFTTCYHLQSLA